MSAHANRFSLYLRAIIFGVTDSLVSTVGLLAGMDVAGASHATLALTGGVYAVVEAFSMAVGNFLSEESVEEYVAHGRVSNALPILAGAVMFVAFVLAALVPLAPYVFLNGSRALGESVCFSIIALFIVGALGARVSRVSALWRGIRMALLGGAAILIGIIVGLFFPTVN